jgi:lysophospholipase L1-like esterase
MPILPPLRHAAVLLCLFSPAAPGLAQSLRFDFGGGTVAPGFIGVQPGDTYTAGRGYGFEPGVALSAVDRGGTDALRRDFVTAERSFHFTARVPREGNYRVTVTLGDAAGESTTSIKAELRRLMAERVTTPRGGFARAVLVVNTRTPAIAATAGIAAGAVKLKAPRETVQEAWAWDEALTLEFSGTRPAVCAVEIEPVEVPTVFLLGDSTVCDQSKEPYSSWGQMLTRWFQPTVAVANHGESGETYRDSIGRRRLDKILSVMRPGDWLLLQFGHNDQKQVAAGTGGPFTTYKAELARHVEAFRARGGTPIVVSPMERRRFDEQGRPQATLQEYAEAARQAATELGAPFIDLQAMSLVLYGALGPDLSARAFAAPEGRVDNTHHNNFGSYQLAKCVAQGIRTVQPALARHLVSDFTGYNPARPDDPDRLALPVSGDFTNQRPLGDEANR